MKRFKPKEVFYDNRFYDSEEAAKDDLFTVKYQYPFMYVGEPDGIVSGLYMKYPLEDGMLAEDDMHTVEQYISIAMDYRIVMSGQAKINGGVEA